VDPCLPSVSLVEAIDLRQVRIITVANQGADSPRLNGMNIGHGSFELCESTYRQDKTSERPCVRCGQIAGVVRDRCLHVERSRREEASVVDQPRHQYAK